MRYSPQSKYSTGRSPFFSADWGRFFLLSCWCCFLEIFSPPATTRADPFTCPVWHGGILGKGPRPVQLVATVRSFSLQPFFELFFILGVWFILEGKQCRFLTTGFLWPNRGAFIVWAAHPLCRKTFYRFLFFFTPLFALQPFLSYVITRVIPTTPIEYRTRPVLAKEFLP